MRSPWYLRRLRAVRRFILLDFRPKPLIAFWSTVRPRAWSLTARRRYEWMRSPTHAKDEV